MERRRVPPALRARALAAQRLQRCWPRSGSADFRVRRAKIDRWHAEQFAYLLAELRRVPDGTKTLLDDSLVL